MADVGERPRARTRAGWSVVTLGLVAATLWLLWQAGTTTWDAAVLAVRGEVVSARVIDAQLHTKLGMADDLVVVPARSDVATTVSTHREDLGVGAVVDVVVDPDDPTRADLAGDGWPWLATIMPLFLAFVCGVSALLTLGAALGLAPPEETDQDAEDVSGKDPDDS